jgi:hypothetical protein
MKSRVTSIGRGQGLDAWDGINVIKRPMTPTDIVGRPFVGRVHATGLAPTGELPTAHRAREAPEA